MLEGSRAWFRGRKGKMRRELSKIVIITKEMVRKKEKGKEKRAGWGREEKMKGDKGGREEEEKKEERKDRRTEGQKEGGKGSV